MMSCSVLLRTSSNTNIVNLHWFPNQMNFNRTQLNPVKMFQLTVDKMGGERGTVWDGGSPMGTISFLERSAVGRGGT